MAFIDTVLQNLGKTAQAYVDVILVFTVDTIEDNVHDLQLAFDWLREHKVKIKSSKCHLAVQEAKCLCYVVQGVFRQILSK